MNPAPTPADKVEDLPDGDWYVEARRGGTVARILFGFKTLIPSGQVPDFAGGCTRIEHPRVVVLTPRPSWSGQPDEAQGPAYLLDGHATFVEQVPPDVALPVLDTMVADGLQAGQNALTRLLSGESTR